MFTNLKLSIILLSLMGCASTQKRQQKPPLNLGEVYFQRWNAGMKGGGYGYNIYIPIPIKEGNTKLDNVYFRDNVSKLNYNKKTNRYLGAIKIKPKVNDDVILSNDLYEEEESKNQLESKIQTIPFKLEPNECVVSYLKDGKTQYFKIKNIIEKPTINYPSVKPN